MSRLDDKKAANRAVKKLFNIPEKPTADSRRIARLERTTDLKTHSKEALIEQILDLENLFHFQKNVIQNLHGGLITVELNGTITFANQRAAELLRVPLKQLPERVAADFFPEMPELDGQTRVPEHESVMRISDGSEVPVRRILQAFTDEINQHTGVLILFEDISEIIDLRRKTQRIEQLEALGDVSAGIAHEIRNPLAGIKSMIQVLDEVITDPNQMEIIQRIVGEVDRANELLQLFFRFAKPARSNPVWVDVEHLIEDVIQRLPSVSTPVQIKTDFSTLLPNAYVDANQLRSVIVEMIENAREAMPAGGGEIRISTRLLEPIGTRPEQVEITFEDNGSGIDAADREKVFQPFFTRKHEHVGMGLSIAMRLMEANDGDLRLLPQTNDLTRFILLIPTRG